MVICKLKEHGAMCDCGCVEKHVEGTTKARFEAGDSALCVKTACGVVKGKCYTVTAVGDNPNMGYYPSYIKVGTYNSGVEQFIYDDLFVQA